MNEIFQTFTYEDGVIVEGLTNELTIFYVLNYFKTQDKSVIVLANTLYEANQLYNFLQTHTENVLFFPMDDFLTSVAVATSPELKLKRLETLEKIKDGKQIVVTNLMGYLKYNPSVKDKMSSNLILKKDQNISREIILETLEKFGYHRDSLVTTTGEYAVRGFVLDIFPIQSDHPIRIEFFGDNIESIRYFDEESQRTILAVEEVNIKVIDEIITNDVSSLLDYMPEATVIIFNNQQVQVGYNKLFAEMVAYNEREDKVGTKYFFEWEELHPKKTLYINTIATDLNKKNVKKYVSKEMDLFHGHYEKLKEVVEGFLYHHKTVVFALSRQSEIKVIKELFAQKVHLVREENFINNVINIWSYKINHGFIFGDYVFISEFDIEDIQKEIKYKNNLKIGRKIHSLNALQPGDYVVHASHGIGIYYGVVALETNGLKKDYLQINYQGNDKIYVPVEKIDIIYKYSDKDGMKPQINKLGSTAWLKKKRSIQKKIKDISGELIKLYAERKTVKSDAYIDYPEEDVFASYFPYEETKDQLRAIDDIAKDLDSEVPMDRLLCGDVGFGKTEVAFRGIFKTILNNKQVFYLCPTTILSKQQYESA